MELEEAGESEGVSSDVARDYALQSGMEYLLQSISRGLIVACLGLFWSH